MQGHHLHAFGTIFLFLLTFKHVAQDQLADGFLNGHTAFFVLFQRVFNASIRNQTLLIR